MSKLSLKVGDTVVWARKDTDDSPVGTLAVTKVGRSYASVAEFTRRRICLTSGRLMEGGYSVGKVFQSQAAFEYHVKRQLLENKTKSIMCAVRYRPLDKLTMDQLDRIIEALTPLN